MKRWNNNLEDINQEAGSMQAGTKKDQLIVAIQKAIDGGADDLDHSSYLDGSENRHESWMHPAAKEARDLSEGLGCDWNFGGWKAALRTLQNYGVLGGVNLNDSRE